MSRALFSSTKSDMVQAYEINSVLLQGEWSLQELDSQSECTLGLDRRVQVPVTLYINIIADVSRVNNWGRCYGVLLESASSMESERTRNSAKQTRQLTHAVIVKFLVWSVRESLHTSIRTSTWGELRIVWGTFEDSAHDGGSALLCYRSVSYGVMTMKAFYCERDTQGGIRAQIEEWGAQFVWMIRRSSELPEQYGDKFLAFITW
ncbi:hypothetical protein Tco_0433018 [Tanacetum coccineum]|uniref:Uncharacterized protein n=1 Tax=Tanacetum coccineum TaxID=301880 RepID=A0ABQ4XZL7_9ASTR